MTMVTNPLTISFWLWLAYQLGVLVLGDPIAGVASDGAGSFKWLADYGWPTVLGMALFAIGGAGIGYLGVKLVWRLRVWLKRRKRRARGLPSTLKETAAPGFASRHATQNILPPIE